MKHIDLIYLLFIVEIFIHFQLYAQEEGSVIWTKTYNGSSNGNDYGYGVTTDVLGNLYTIGCEWKNGEDKNIWIAKYDKNGNNIWLRNHNGSADSDDVGYRLVIDDSGNLYAVGFVTNTNEDRNIWVRKYNNDGYIIWNDTYNGLDNGKDEGRDIAISNSGNIYAVGYENDYSSNTKVWLRNYDSDGNIIWTKKYGNEGNPIRGNGIDVDLLGNLYVIGNKWIDGQSWDIWLGKYDKDGYEIWSTTQAGRNNTDDFGFDIVIDGLGYIYVTGIISSDIGYQIWIRKYDAIGSIIWTKTYYGSAVDGHGSGGMSIAIDSTNNIYVTGYESVRSGIMDIIIQKYDKNSNLLWTDSCDNGSVDSGNGITLDNSGNIYAIGYTLTLNEARDIWISKYASSLKYRVETKEGNVKIIGGKEGFVNPLKGENAEIVFNTTNSGKIEIYIFDLNGKLVWKDSKNTYNSGIDSINWNCKNMKGLNVSTGIYILYIEGPGIKTKKKIAVIE